MKRLFLILILSLPILASSAVLPENNINVFWNPHPQHSVNVSVDPPLAPITIHIFGRVVLTGTDLDVFNTTDPEGNPASYLEWGTALGDGNFSINGMTASYGQEIQVKLKACWDDPTTPNLEDINCSGLSQGVAYVVPLGDPGLPTGIGLSVS